MSLCDILVTFLDDLKQCFDLAIHLAGQLRIMRSFRSAGKRPYPAMILQALGRLYYHSVLC